MLGVPVTIRSNTSESTHVLLPDPSHVPRPVAMKCQSRECFQPAGQPDKPRSIYCSRRCQSREQNLRQGRIKSTRRPDSRFRVERNRKFEGAAFSSYQSVFSGRNTPMAAPVSSDLQPESPPQPPSPPTFPSSLTMIEQTSLSYFDRSSFQPRNDGLEYPVRPLLPSARELIQRVTGEA